MMPSPGAAAGSPEELVMPYSNQVIAPALWPPDQDPPIQAELEHVADPVGLPDRDQIDQASPADVDRVLAKQMGAHIDRIRGRDGRGRCR